MDAGTLFGEERRVVCGGESGNACGHEQAGAVALPAFLAVNEHWITEC